MIEFSEALKIVLSNAERVGIESVSLENICGRFLAQDIVVPCDLPPFNKSAVDGYACRREDVLKMQNHILQGNTSGGDSHINGLSLLLLEVIPAGCIGTKTVVEGTCSKIMTGAPLPMGADMVLMVEQCEEVEVENSAFSQQFTTVSSAELTDSEKSVFVSLCDGSQSSEKIASKSNICLRGEDAAAGSVLLREGHIIRPQDVAVIATCGLSQVFVHKQIKVGIISTGSELLEPGSVEPMVASVDSSSSNADGSTLHQVGSNSADTGFDPLPKGKIFNSNSWQLLSLLRNMGAEVSYYGIAPDTLNETEDILSRAVDENQLVLLSGGVSEGDFDFVPIIIRKLGFEILFNRVAVQPGKPTTFAVSGSKYIFGLPGNPVSAFVQTLLLVKPLIVNMQGGEYSERFISMPIAGEYSRRNAERTAHIPIRILYDGTCMPLEYHGSAHISALCEADGLIRIPIGVTHFDSGEKVSVMLF